MEIMKFQIDMQINYCFTLCAAGEATCASMLLITISNLMPFVSVNLSIAIFIVERKPKFEETILIDKLLFHAVRSERLAQAYF